MAGPRQGGSLHILYICVSDVSLLFQCSASVLSYLLFLIIFICQQMLLLPSGFLLISTIRLLILVCDLPPRLLSQYIETRNISFPCELDFHEQCASSEQHCFYLQLETTFAANKLLAVEDVAKLFSDADDDISVSRLDINFSLTTKPSKEGRVGYGTVA